MTLNVCNFYGFFIKKIKVKKLHLLPLGMKKNSHLPAGELSSPVDTLDSSSQDNLQSTRTSEVQVQLNHYAKN